MAGSRLLLLGLSLGLLCGCQSPVSLRSVSYSPLAPLEESVVFHPNRYPEGDWQPRGLEFEDARFESADGTRLHGWFIQHENPRAVVLFCHGNGGNVAMWGDELRILHDRLGVTALSFDYRGYGRSEGVPTEEGVLADARAARRWLANRAGIPESEVVVMGRSLGGAVAIDLATDGARGLVIESTFTSMPAVGHAMFPWLPMQSVMQTQFDSLSKIKKYHGPLLQSHGSGDRLLPYAMGQELFDAANPPKKFVTIPNGDHQDPQTPEYYAAFDAFLNSLPAVRDSGD
jgi:fermentation-respiration switch protein FrsA (DUF1100 family)